MIRAVGILEDVDAHIEDWRFALNTHDPGIVLHVFKRVSECLQGAGICDVLIVDNEIEHPETFEVEYAEEHLKTIRVHFRGVLVWYSSVLPSPENRRFCNIFLRSKYPLPDIRKFLAQAEGELSRGREET